MKTPDFRLVRNAFNPLILDAIISVYDSVSDSFNVVDREQIQLSTIKRIVVTGMGGDDELIVDSRVGGIVVEHDPDPMTGLPGRASRSTGAVERTRSSC